MGRSEVLAHLDPDQARADDIVIEDPAIGCAAKGIAADRLAALDRAVDHAAAVEQIGREQFGVPALALHADAEVSGRIGLEVADNSIFERPKVGPPLADMVDRELDMPVDAADREFVARDGIALELRSDRQARSRRGEQAVVGSRAIEVGRTLLPPWFMACRYRYSI